MHEEMEGKRTASRGCETGFVYIEFDVSIQRIFYRNNAI